MVNETNLKDLIERQRRYIDTLDNGTDEYVSAVKLLMDLEKELSEIEKNEAEMVQDQKSRRVGTILEAVKIATNVGLPLVGYVVIVAAEKDITFTGALRDVTKCFLPKKI